MDDNMGKCISTILEDNIAMYRVSYKDFEDLVCNALDNFGYDTVDLLINRLKKYRKHEKKLRGEKH